MDYKKDILVTVVSLAYNHEPYIRQCLEGFVMQKTNFAFEVLIHDDASTDGTADIIREYELKYPDIIKPIYQKENQYSKGVFIEKTFLYPNAKGKYIAECEGDDYWIDPYKLQKQVDFLEANPDYGLVYTDLDMFYVAKDKIIKDYYKTNNIQTFDGYVFEKLMDPQYYFVRTLTTMVRTELAKKAIDFCFEHKNDFDTFDLSYWLELSRYTKFKYLSDTTSVYRILSDSMSNFSDAKKRYNWHKKVQKVRNFYASYYNASDEIKFNLEKCHIKSDFSDALAMSDREMVLSLYPKILELNINLSLKNKVLFYLIRFRFKC